MDDAKTVWSLWQSLLKKFQSQFTRGGWVRFCQWVTGLVLCPEEHTITQILISLGMEDRWRVMESFAEYGSWNQEEVERQLIRVVEDEQLPGWGKYRVMAVDIYERVRSCETRTVPLSQRDAAKTFPLPQENRKDVLPWNRPARTTVDHFAPQRGRRRH